MVLSSAAARRVGAALGVVGTAAAVAVLCLGLRWVVVSLAGLHLSPWPVGTAGALLGVMAAPPVRLPLERRDAAGRGAVIVLAGMVLAGTIVTSLGLGLLVAVTSAGVAAHAVQVRPTRRQLTTSCAMVAVTSASAWGVQAAGWVDGVVEPGPSAALVLALLVVMCPQVANAASISRRAQQSARALEAERAERLEALERAALRDPLTGLLSRRGLVPPLERAVAAARPGHLVGVLFVDLDGFKQVNDVHGHAAGDALLSEVARRVLGVLRATDVAARVGGDEFVVVCSDLAEEEQARATAERLRREVERVVVLADGTRVGVGASIGVAAAAAPAPAETLLARADAGMYTAKRARRAERGAPSAPVVTREVGGSSSGGARQPSSRPAKTAAASRSSSAVPDPYAS